MLLAKIGKYDRVEYFCEGVSIEPRIRPNFRLIQTAEGPGIVAWVDAAFGRTDNASLRFRINFDNIRRSKVVFEWYEKVERGDIRDIPGRREDCSRST
jgi:hypothetical protein